MRCKYTKICWQSEKYWLKFESSKNDINRKGKTK